jgi:uncharacterized heparinase superfamily protein
MISGKAIALTARVIAFGRHIPPRKLARRVELSLRRQVRDRWVTGERADAPPPRRESSLLRPLFAPRRGMIEPHGDVARFNFIGHDERLRIPDIDFGALPSDPKYQLWRMNLHYMEYLEEVQDLLWAGLVGAWIAANPPSRRGAWKDSWNSYALSIRVVVWMQELVRRAGRLPAAVVMRADASLARQLRFLKENVETDLGGNHLIKNIKALIWASAYFSGAEAARWRTAGLRLLRSELVEQILSDGMHCERSPSYHCQVFADLLEIRHALGENPLKANIDNALHQMAQVAADLCHPDGRVALFNDAGLDMAYTPAECLSVYQQMFSRTPSPREAFALEKAGYFGLRSNDNYFVLDCGRIAPDDLPAHGHGDVLSFEWSVAGKRIIVDQGVFEYVSGERRRRSRAAANHNTLCFEGADQADFFGAFRCGRRPNVKVSKYEKSGDGFVFEGTHDGFSHLHGGPRHIRRFEVRSRRVMIHDRIEGDPEVPASIGFLLEPDVEVEVSGSNALLRQKASRVQMTSTLPIHVEDAVWWPNMGHEEPTKRLRIRLAPGASELLTAFQVLDAAESS